MPYKKTHCKYYASGACIKGAACTFIHHPSRAPPPPCSSRHVPACSPLHMQQMSVAMSSGKGSGRQLQRRLDVRAETSSFATRPLLLWAFQSSQWQLQAVFGPRPSLLRVSAAQSRAFGCHFGAKYRQSLLTCSRLSVTLAAMLVCFEGQCAVDYPLRKALHSVAAPQVACGAVGGGCSCGRRLRARHRQQR